VLWFGGPTDVTALPRVQRPVAPGRVDADAVALDETGPVHVVDQLAVVNDFDLVLGAVEERDAGLRIAESVGQSTPSNTDSPPAPPNRMELAGDPLLVLVAAVRQLLEISPNKLP
jgi:hypothetical protein